MIETPEQILELIQDTPSLAALVGTYVFDDGLTAPAVAILEGTQQVEGLERIEGVEVIIPRTPSGRSQPLVDGGAIRSKTWRLYLIQYRGAAPGAVVELADQLLSLLPGSSYTNVGGAGVDSVAGEEQLAFQIPAHVTL